MIFKLDDRPTCPGCNKSLDEGPARDYVVWRWDGSVSPVPQDADCGWCDAMFTVIPIQKGSEITIQFKLKY